MSRLVLSLALCALLAAATAWGLSWMARHRSEPVRLSPRELGPVPVATRVLEPTESAVWVRAFGTLLASREAVLASEVGGRVASVRRPWRIGERVEEGELLVLLDTALLDQELRAGEAALDEARAGLRSSEVELEFAQSALELAAEQLDLARADERRSEELQRAGAVSESRLDGARTQRSAAALVLDRARGRRRQAEVGRVLATKQVARAEAARDLAAERRRRAEIRAPFAGRLAGRPPAEGTHLAPGQSVARVVDLERLHLSVRVGEGELAGLRAGLPAVVVLPALPGRELAAQVRAVGVEADPESRTVGVELELPNPAEDGGLDADERRAPLLRAGQFAEARLRVRDLPRALVLHPGEFVWREGLPTAFVAVEQDEGPPVGGRGSDWREADARTVELRTVELGARLRTAAGARGFEVRGGLAPGELLITSPLSRLYGGEPCRPTPDVRAGAGAGR